MSEQSGQNDPYIKEGKMRELFPAYYGASAEDNDRLWDEAVFAFDTNFLLHLYTYKKTSRQRTIRILTKLKNRLWLPYQVALEYQRNRR